MKPLILAALAITAGPAMAQTPAFTLAAPDTGECVVLLHGLARSEASLAPMGEALKIAGYRVVNSGYPSTAEPIALPPPSRSRHWSPSICRRILPNAAKGG
ncbi:esterase/lipase family protein [Ketogulonicigenium vulgare]|uniref:esterase/lipase family protein n=1 Tax=Ketogulonicigenium vulgare TaxID=92945 RepID=UPI003467D7CD